jgi:hypothetical protein
MIKSSIESHHPTKKMSENKVKKKLQNNNQKRMHSLIKKALKSNNKNQENKQD